MRRLVIATLLAATLAAVPAAWACPAHTIRIVDVRPLATSDPNLEQLIAHHFAVRVETGAARWRLFLDGNPIEESASKVIDTPYLVPGTHWIAAQLRHGNVWSEPVVLHVPKTVRCWQTGARPGAITCRPRG